MGYVDTKDTSQNICTWKHEVGFPSAYICVDIYIYTHVYRYVCMSCFSKSRIHCRCLYRNWHTLRPPENQTSWKYAVERHLAWYSLPTSSILASWFCKCWLFLILLWIRQCHLEVRLWRNRLSLLTAVGQSTFVYGEENLLAVELPLEHHFTYAREDSCYLFWIMDCVAPANFLLRVLCTAALCALSVRGLLTSCSLRGWVCVRCRCGLSDAVCWQHRRSC